MLLLQGLDLRLGVGDLASAEHAGHLLLQLFDARLCVVDVDFQLLQLLSDELTAIALVALSADAGLRSINWFTKLRRYGLGALRIRINDFDLEQLGIGHQRHGVLW